MIKRELREQKVYNNTTLQSTDGPRDDTSAPGFRDDDPQSGGSNGKVYDLDAPGIKNPAGSPVGRISRVRHNFRQWAQLSSGQRVSTDLFWFSRTSVVLTYTGDALQNDVPGDNVAGLGTTNTTWNLQ